MECFDTSSLFTYTRVGPTSAVMTDGSLHVEFKGCIMTNDVPDLNIVKGDEISRIDLVKNRLFFFPDGSDKTPGAINVDTDIRII